MDNFWLILRKAITIIEIVCIFVVTPALANSDLELLHFTAPFIFIALAFATWPRKKEDKKPEENKIQEQDQDQQLDKNIQAVKNTETDTVQKKAKSINKNKATHPVAKKTPYKTKTKKAKASPEAKGLTLQTTVIMNAKNERKNLENWLKQNDRRNWDLNTDEKLIASRSKEPIYEFKDTNTTDVS